MDQLTDYFARARTWFGGLPPGKRTSLIVSVALSLALTSVLWGVAAYDPMVALFPTPLDNKTTTDVMAYLETNEIPHKVESGSQRIMVPRSRAERVAAQLRGSSVMAGSAAGREIIDNAPIGTTQFMERHRWTMALQSEIETQINGFDQVIGSKVLLSMPEQSLFMEDKVDPSASVYVELKTGTTLSSDEGSRVASMVAAAVPRLAPDRVEILDSDLRVIHSMRSSDSTVGASSDLADLRRQYDAYYTDKVERLLERIVGPGKVVAQVNVDLDHTEKTVSQRELDGENAVVISQRSREATMSGASKGGVPGTTANSPELEGVAGTSGRNSNEADEVANIDVPDKETLTASLPGGILGITASVIVDGTWETPAATTPAEGEAAPEADTEAAAEPVYVPRSAAEIEEYRAVVAAAIGTTPEKVTVINQQFATLSLTPATNTAAVTAPDWTEYLPWAAVALAMMLSFLFVVRPAMKSMSASALEEMAEEAALALGDGVAGALEEPEEDLEEQQNQQLADWLDRIASGDRGFVTRGEVTRLVKADVVHSVVTLQTWISEDV
ncbi:MAG: flagellar M-ring protein FliF [Proteobacteria bacterium]|nr:flagellar M-ring protein FliF [Pseudomonadota bacterium]